MERVVRRFQARGSDEHIYTVVEYQDFIENFTRGRGRSVMPGLKRFATSTGQAVTAPRPGTYRIVATGVVLQPEQR